MRAGRIGSASSSTCGSWRPSGIGQLAGALQPANLPMQASVGCPAAVDDHRRACHERGGIRCEIHEGACGIHQGARTIIGKVLRSGYYWTSLKADAEKLVKCCTKCQFFTKVPRKPTNYLSPMQSVLPFDKWG